MPSSTIKRVEEHGRSRSAHRWAAVALASITALLMGQGSRRSPAPDEAPIVTRDQSTVRDWTVRVEVALGGLTPQKTDARNPRPATTTLALSRASILYPMLPDTSTSLSDERKFEAKVRVEGKVLDNTPRFERGYQGLSSIAILDIQDVNSTRLNIEYEIAMVCFETKIDEKRARLRTWPSAPWSPELLLCMEPQLFVESRDDAVAELVRKWTRGNPQGTGPYDLAKMLAAQVIAHVDITESPYVSGSGAKHGLAGASTATGFTSGFNVSGAAWAARERRASRYDIACLYAATLRAAGLPARLVIGYDIDESEKGPNARPIMRSWVEFFLPNAPAGDLITPTDGEWIPVDVHRQKEFASRAPSLSQPWVYFGNNDELDRVCPLAFHWLPPTVCTNAGPAAIWGWVPEPANPGATQELKFWARPTPMRGDEPPPRRK